MVYRRNQNSVRNNKKMKPKEEMEKKSMFSGLYCVARPTGRSTAAIDACARFNPYVKRIEDMMTVLVST